MITTTVDGRATSADARRQHDERHEAAAPGCRQPFGRAADTTEVLHLLGVVAIQAGRPHEAVGLIAQAIALHPDRAAYFCNLGEAHRALGELAEALACQRQALALDPTLAAAHNNLGLVQQAQGGPGAARASYRPALALKPTLATAAINPGTVGASDGRTAAAVIRFEHALALAPRPAGAPAQPRSGVAGSGRRVACASNPQALALGPAIALLDERLEARSVSAKRQLVLPPLTPSTMDHGGSNPPSG